MSILITGAAGFIGSALAEELIRSGEQIVCIDSFTDYYSQDLKNARVDRLKKEFGIPTLNLDLNNVGELELLFKSHKINSVINLAAQAGVRLNGRQRLRYIHSNLNGFGNVLLMSQYFGVQEFLYASSSSVYGNSNQIPFLESEENIQPISLYGATKFSNELLANSVVDASSMKIRGLRIFTVYGAYGRPDMAYFRMINSVLNDKIFSLNGDGEIKRDFTYIADLTAVIRKLLNNLRTQPQGFIDIVNTGGGEPKSINDLKKEIERYYGTKMKIRNDISDSFDVKITSSSSKYLHSLIGKQKFTPLDKGIVKVCNWASKEGIKEKLNDWVESSYLTN